MKPLILFSLPRSGSTLTQRILASHEQISTISEPWLLLPYLYTLKNSGITAEYGHFMLSEAINDLCTKLPNGRGDYLDEMREFVTRLYEKIDNKSSTYFLDKTPRYHLIAEEIFQLFPQGKFIFLWRHPLAVVASIIETWADGKWNLFRYEIDIYNGIENLVNAYCKNKNRAFALKYEDLLSNREEELNQLLAYLDLPLDMEWASESKIVKLPGRWGNPPKAKRYNSLSVEPLEKWKLVLSNPLRKAWCFRYLNWIGEERLNIMGYSLDEILEELTSIPMNFDMLSSDLLRMPYGAFHSATKPKFVDPMLKKNKLLSI